MRIGEEAYLSRICIGCAIKSGRESIEIADLIDSEDKDTGCESKLHKRVTFVDHRILSSWPLVVVVL